MTNPADGKHLLSLVGVSDDGTTLYLENEFGESFSLEVDESVREAVLITEPDDQVKRFTSIAVVSETVTTTSETVTLEEHRGSHPLRVVTDQPHTSAKEIQARLRAGESVASIAANSSWNSEKIEKFSGPIYQERAFIIAQALRYELKKRENMGLNKTLEDIVLSTLSSHGVEPESLEWNTHRELNGDWTLILSFPSENGVRTATWSFNSEKGLLVSRDDDARWLSGEKQSSRPRNANHGFLSSTQQNKSEPSYGETIFPSATPIAAPRLVAVEDSDKSENNLTSEKDSLFDIEENENSDSEGKSRVTLPSWDEIIFGGKKED